MNQKTDLLFSATGNYSLAVALVIQNLDISDQVNHYFDRWGSHLKYIQVLNEPELSSSWDVGALFTDDDITSKFEIMYDTVESHNLSVELH